VVVVPAQKQSEIQITPKLVLNCFAQKFVFLCGRCFFISRKKFLKLNIQACLCISTLKCNNFEKATLFDKENELDFDNYKVSFMDRIIVIFKKSIDIDIRSAVLSFLLAPDMALSLKLTKMQNTTKHVEEICVRFNSSAKFFGKHSKKYVKKKVYSCTTKQKKKRTTKKLTI
ncbi:hypothetical protein RFI_31803, partial [Reticulomyxa filosa]